MAEEVFLSEGKLVGRGSTSGVPRTALAGGDELFFAEITSNFTSSSTTFIDVTGLTGTLTVPEGPYMLELIAPVFVPASGVNVSMQIVTGSTLLVSDGFDAASANTGDLLHMRTRLPNSMHTASVGSTVTYKAQMKSSTTATAVSVFVDLAGRLNTAFLRAFRV